MSFDDGPCDDIMFYWSNLGLGALLKSTMMMAHELHLIVIEP